MARAPKHKSKTKPVAAAPGAPPPAAPLAGTARIDIGHPVFAQPLPTPDPTKFEVQHVSDGPAYKKIDALNRAHKLFPLPFPLPRGYADGTPEPVLTLAEILGGDDKAVANITKAGQLVFHSVGDTGNTRGPATQSLVADKMVTDFADPNPADAPAFFFHLGDVIYSFGEAKYYYDQFYDPYREYPAPIIALAGNHDGMVAPDTNAESLRAFLDNFCQAEFMVAPEAGGLSRTAQIQPGVFFTFEAPFVRIICLYSGTLEDPGVIADGNVGDAQSNYLKAALARVKKEKFAGALIIAHHHPAYTAGTKHGWSIDMLAQIDAACNAAGVWPHAVLSAHAHNYQRFTRVHGKTEIPYIVAGNGGHGLARIARAGVTMRTPAVVQAAGAGADQVTLESYDDADYGYLRIIATASLLTIEYHPAADGGGMKTPDDRVAVDLARRVRA